MWNSRLPAAGLLAAASTVHAQDCLWTTYGSQPPGYGRMVYHTGLQRVLFVVTEQYPSTGLQIWSWDGADWTLLSSDGPSIRVAPGVAYDSARDRVVLFGGRGGPGGYTSLAETWEWDRSVWVQSAASGPSARLGLGMAYDESRQRTVLFGGHYESTSSYIYLGDTWEWDGQGWTRVATSGPAPENVSCFAYDSIRARTVLFGGDPNGSTRELWEWDGTVWTLRSSVQGGPWGWWMVFDPGRARMIAARFEPRQTWELDPPTAAWTLRDPGLGPPGPAAFDLARSRAIVINWTGIPTTFEYNGAATIVPPSIIQQPSGQTMTCGHNAVFRVQASGTPLTYQWRRNGQPLTNGGNISGVDTDTLTVSNVTIGDSASFDVVLSNPCATIASNPAQLSVDPTCYANCDQSTTPPILNVNDFACFLNKFAAGDTYANCTGGCNPPPCLNILDFGCFLNKFAAGCCTSP